MLRRRLHDLQIRQSAHDCAFIVQSNDRYPRLACVAACGRTATYAEGWSPNAGRAGRLQSGHRGQPIPALGQVIAPTEWLVKRKIGHPQHLAVAVRVAVGKNLMAVETANEFFKPRDLLRTATVNPDQSAVEYSIPPRETRAQHVVKAERLCKIRKVNVERSADEDETMLTIAMPAHTPDRPRPQQVGGDSRGESLGCSPAAPNANPKGAAMPDKDAAATRPRYEGTDIDESLLPKWVRASGGCVGSNIA
jgi:hypothetical protein